MCCLQRLPRALHQHFPADRSSTWVLLRHGSKAWPVETVNHEFHKGWDDFRKANELEVNHKLTLACECKWIFHTIMFDRCGWELYLVGLVQMRVGKICILQMRTAYLPSAFMAHYTVLKFVYFHVHGP